MIADRVNDSCDSPKTGRIKQKATPEIANSLCTPCPDDKSAAAAAKTAEDRSIAKQAPEDKSAAAAKAAASKKESKPKQAAPKRPLEKAEKATSKTAKQSKRQKKAAPKAELFCVLTFLNLCLLVYTCLLMKT